ncbi:hypothetical protein [Sulfurimicrobium lacus]|uniref:hypothetical protein n=1 Tax=Sulfurimicrobium lacus TaxID=2715678 RepID=UPI0015653FB4|nr:hypothetical protein [Sulfurimicrobium lacus]
MADSKIEFCEEGADLWCAASGVAKNLGASMPLYRRIPESTHAERECKPFYLFGDFLKRRRM